VEWLFSDIPFPDPAPSNNAPLKIGLSIYNFFNPKEWARFFQLRKGTNVNLPPFSTSFRRRGYGY
jgi:hypothetical protein